MLAFELSNEGRTIEILCDGAGIDSLIDVLAALKKSGGHVHLRTPMNVNDKFAKLSPTDPWGDPTIGEVVITLGGD